jgi:hypothetical protein
MRMSRFPVLAVLAALTLTACQSLAGATADVGDCVQVSDLGEEIQSLPIVPCDEPHEAEVYAVFDLDSDGAYNEDALAVEIDDECLSRFEDFVGTSYDESVLDVYLIYPLEEGWATGDREVTCAVLQPDATGGVEEVTGTLKGANR